MRCRVRINKFSIDSAMPSFRLGDKQVLVLTLLSAALRSGPAQLINFLVRQCSTPAKP